MIRERIGDEHIFSTWFSDITLEQYDETENVVLLRVPNKYVYEYLEQFCTKLLLWALAACFKPGVRMNYRLTKEPSFADVAEYLRQNGFDDSNDGVRISIQNARKRMEDGLRYFLGDSYKWLPAYDSVAEWLADNKGKGLLCVGASGLGKTIVCTKILPVLLGRNITSVTATEMNKQIDNLVKERMVIVDDLGKEDATPKVYGTVRRPFFELCDTAEKKGNLLIVTTNLSTTKDFRYPTSIEERYGNDVIGRLRTTVSVVVFEGDDMRA